MERSCKESIKEDCFHDSLVTPKMSFRFFVSVKCCGSPVPNLEIIEIVGWEMQILLQERYFSFQTCGIKVILQYQSFPKCSRSLVGYDFVSQTIFSIEPIQALRALIDHRKLALAFRA